MAGTAKKPKYTIEIEAPANGRIRQATIIVRDTEGKTLASDQANLSAAKERRRVGQELARQLGEDDPSKLQAAIESKWAELLDEQRRVKEQMAAGSPEAVAVEAIQLLDATPLAIRRPLALIDGRAYAAAWLTAQRTVSRSVDPHTGTVTDHDPPSCPWSRCCSLFVTMANRSQTRRCREGGRCPSWGLTCACLRPCRPKENGAGPA